MRIKELFHARNELYCMGGNRTGAFYGVYMNSSRLLISYLQCVGGQSPLLFLVYITHRISKNADKSSSVGVRKRNACTTAFQCKDVLQMLAHQD